MVNEVDCSIASVLVIQIGIVIVVVETIIVAIAIEVGAIAVGNCVGSAMWIVIIVAIIIGFQIVSIKCNHVVIIAIAILIVSTIITMGIIVINIIIIANWSRVSH